MSQIKQDMIGQIDLENMSLIGNRKSNGCSVSKIKFGKLRQIELEMLSQIEPEQPSQIINGESNVCSMCQIKQDN